MVTVFITNVMEPFHEIAVDSTGFPAFGEFRSFAFGGMLALVVCCTDAGHVLNLLNEIGGRKNRLSTLIDNSSWIASTLSLLIFELFRISGLQISHNN